MRRRETKKARETRDESRKRARTVDPPKRGAQGYRKTLSLATRGQAALTRGEEGVEEDSEVPRDRNRRLVEGVGRGFGRHGDKQPLGPSQLVAGVGRKGWPRASAGQAG